MRASFACLFAIAVAGCFPPDLGDGAVACGNNGSCPPRYFCHAADQKCWKTPDPGMSLDMSIIVGDGAMAPPDMTKVDLAGADLSVCVKVSCGTRNCGTIPDGCGGIESCPPGCTPPQTCGGGNTGVRMPNVCNSGPNCTPKTCQVGIDCGLISDGCSAVLNCGMCLDGKMCVSGKCQ